MNACPNCAGALVRIGDLMICFSPRCYQREGQTVRPSRSTRRAVRELNGAASMDRRTWYFEQQAGRCYLMIDEHCRRVEGAMGIDHPSNQVRIDRRATWEHLTPLSSRPAEKLVLLACSGCNRLKGSRTDVATPEHFERARELRDAWAATREQGRAA